MRTRQIFIFISLLYLGFIQTALGQTQQDTVLQWLQQHQDELTYRFQSNEEEYTEESFRFLLGRVVQHTKQYDDEGKLLSKEEQEWFYSEFIPIGNIDSLEIDTIYSNLCIISLTCGPPLDIINEYGESTGRIAYSVFRLGFLLSDSIAKQTVLDAVKKIKKLTPQN